MKKIYALLITTILLMTACQPTPEEEVVIQRDNTEKMVIEAAKEENDNIETEDEFVFEYEIPEHVSERFTLVEGVMDIIIDADVTMPEVDSVPVAKIKSSPFTQERADELRKYFMQDGKLVTQYVRTKEDYDALIIKAKRGQEIDGEFVVNESSQNLVNRLIAEREKAPDEDVSNLISDYSISGKGVDGRIIIEGEEIGGLCISEYIFLYDTNAICRVDKGNEYDDKGNAIEYPTVEINMSEEEAVQKAQCLLSELNISGMEVKEMHKTYFYDSFDGYADQAVPEKGGYLIWLMREFGELMPIHISGGAMSQHDKYEVSPPFHAERIRIIIDDSGKIHSFSWEDPIEITEVLTEHINILPFEEILERFRSFSKIQWAYLEESAADLMRIIKVRNVEFNLIYLPIKNNSTEYMYAPCWAFEYKQVTEYTQEDLDRLDDLGIVPLNEEEMATNYLIFSAVDGASVSVCTSKEYEEYEKRRAGYESSNGG